MYYLNFLFKRVYLLITLWLLSLYGYGQNEAAVWYFGNGYGLNFIQGSPKVVQEGPTAGLSTYTYSNTAGEVLLSANRVGIFNSKGNPIENGTWELNPQDEIYIIRKPGSRSLFYVFYVKVTDANTSPSQINNAVMYAIVDITANDGAGMVLEKDKIVYSNLHGSFTISALCANNTYWLVGEVNTNVSAVNSDQFLAFKITAEGIAIEPVRSEPVSIGNSSDLKFSPKGDKLVFGYDGNPGFEGTGLADFNTQTGEVAKSIRLEQRGWQAEFSASGNKLYLSGFYQNPEKVWQYDLTVDNAQQILASKNLVYDGPTNLGEAQLAFDRKIYLIQPDNRRALAVINNPERTGAACGVTPNVLILPKEIESHLPTFASNLLFNYPFKPDAGPDKTVCQGKPVQLGGTKDSRYTYHWEPASYLSDPNSSHPVFTYPDPINDTLKFTYTLYVNDGFCVRVDEVVVSVLPIPEKAILKGSKSVCPGVENVSYQVKVGAGHSYRWSVSGGKLVSGQGTTAIQVSWGPTNANAQVKVIVINKYGCESEETILPVRINVELKPETPQGSELVCLNQVVANQYTVTPTTGSVYTWGIIGGTITTGQGTNQVTADWSGVGKHKIWIQEKSTTVDTICFGMSDTLQVIVFKDTTTLIMQNVSVSQMDEKQVEITWTSSDSTRLQGPLTLWRRPFGSVTWFPVGNPSGFSFNDTGVITDEDSYEYQINASNGCNQPINSSQHHTVQLKAIAKEEEGKIELTWNPYDGWPDGVERYEIWRQLDEEADMKLMGQVNRDNLIFSGLTTAGFSHKYRIKAIARNSLFYSWSNAVDFTFTHELIVPNIFTPNGDGQNDVFAIRTIELYPDNELTIYNRWGQQVLKAEGYSNTWSAANVANGVYYYQLLLRKTGKQIKGWVEVVR